jgi:hypothetical protein
MAEESALLAAARNDRIQLATMRPPASRSASLDRRVVITGPPELVQLAQSGRKEYLEDLIALLKVPDRAWAAEVMLAAMTHREEKLVDAFQANPDGWWDALGKTSYERWSKWFEDARDRLEWDGDERMFVEKPRQ